MFENDEYLAFIDTKRCREFLVTLIVQGGIQNWSSILTTQNIAWKNLSKASMVDILFLIFTHWTGNRPCMKLQIHSPLGDAINSSLNVFLPIKEIIHGMLISWLLIRGWELPQMTVHFWKQGKFIGYRTEKMLPEGNFVDSIMKARKFIRIQMRTKESAMITNPRMKDELNL